MKESEPTDHRISFVQASLPDVEALVSTRIAFLSELLGAQPPGHVDELRKSLEAYFKEALAAGAYIGWLAKENQQVVSVGGVVLRSQPGNFKNPSGRVGYILNMYTIPSHRRKGISNTLLNLLIDSARQKGVYCFELHATKDGEPVYQNNGFELHTEPTYRKYTLRKV